MIIFVNNNSVGFRRTAVLSTMSTADAEAQDDELLALASIFDEGVLQCVDGDDGTRGGRFIVDVSLASPITLHTDNNDNDREVTPSAYRLSHLPPIHLHFSLPRDYPSRRGPHHMITCSWLSEQQLQLLSQRLDDIWNENGNSVVLYLWFSFIQEETIQTIGLDSGCLDVGHFVRRHKEYLMHIRENRSKANSSPAITQTTSADDEPIASTHTVEVVVSEEESSADKVAHERSEDETSAIKGNAQGSDCRERTGEKSKETNVKTENRGYNGKWENRRRNHNHGRNSTGTSFSGKQRVPSSPVSTSKESNAASGSGKSRYSDGHVSDEPTGAVKSGAQGTSSDRAERKSGENRFYQRKTRRHGGEGHVTSQRNSWQQEEWTRNQQNCDSKRGGGRGNRHRHRHNRSVDKKTVPEKPEQEDIDRNGSSDTKCDSEEGEETKMGLGKTTVASEGRSGVEEALKQQRTGERSGDVSPFLSSVLCTFDPSQSIVGVLLDYDQLQRGKQFDRRSFDCGVCFDEKLGFDCIQFDPCQHVFCKLCVKSYFEVQISSGQVNRLLCPQDKCSTHASQAQVRDIVDPAVFARYDSLLLSSGLDSMSDLTYCPRVSCANPVILEAGEVMGHCPTCQYAFCIFCRSVFHGVAPCRMREEERRHVFETYQNGDADDRHRLEKRYGKRQVRILVENILSESWKSTNSQNCPKCQAAIEKFDGCNKVTCYKCHTYFCWLCLQRLNPSNPYFHYQDPKSPCYSRLFQGVDVERDEFDDDEDDDWVEELVGPGEEEEGDYGQLVEELNDDQDDVEGGGGGAPHPNAVNGEERVVRIGRFL